MAHLSTHLHPDHLSSRRSSFRRRRSRSRSPSVHPQRPQSPSTTQAYTEDDEQHKSQQQQQSKTTTTTTSITTTTTSGDQMITTTATTTIPVCTTEQDHHQQQQQQQFDEYGRQQQQQQHSPSKLPDQLGFADTVSDLVGIVKYETSRKGRAKCKYRSKINQFD